MQAEDILSTALSKFSFVNRIDNSVDIGVDFICEYRCNDKPTGKLFNVQCKTLPINFDIKLYDTIDYSIKVKTARYWLQLPNITLLMVVDPTNGNVYWTNPIEHLISRDDDWREKETIQLKIQVNTEFNCFNPTPEALINCVSVSNNHIDVSLNERIYEIKHILLEEQQKGIIPNAVVVAKNLMGSSPLQDAIKSYLALEEFQSEIYNILLARVKKYLSLLPGFISKWYGKHLRKKGVHSNPLEKELDGIKPKDILFKANAIIEALEENKEKRNFNNLLEALDILETLERSISKIESEEYEKEKPIIDIMMQLLNESGANNLLGKN